ncbi:hypothetical protein BTN49_1802 [Candidatus Enterovibrio escicola]|uniref:Uncharacterized protein n=1 Tax=Candidatus Enterovibrio escicola TaxID=1927127 RepID=A0A2A5T333_9GAMM|nr:hypothetical protein BTN49_1802 [Candidatus Enterovibrio escacola]
MLVVSLMRSDANTSRFNRKSNQTELCIRNELNAQDHDLIV